jgi:hypothetical protein
VKKSRVPADSVFFSLFIFFLVVRVNSVSDDNPITRIHRVTTEQKRSQPEETEFFRPWLQQTFIRLPTAHTSPADLATELEESVQTNASIIQETAKRAIESQRRHFAKHLSKQRASWKEIRIMSEEETSKEPKPNFTTPVASLVKATLTDAFRQHAVFASTDVTSISRRNAAIKKAIDEVTTANEQQLNAEATFEDFSAMSDTLYTVGHKLAQDFTNIAW